MNTWLSGHQTIGDDLDFSLDPGVEDRLRQMDVALAILGITMLALPLGLALLVGKLVREPQRGRNRTVFDRLSISFPTNFIGMAFGFVGASHWPVMINILRGEMAWIGPCINSNDIGAAAHFKVRPGIANPWTIRQRTASDFASEQTVIMNYLKRRSPSQSLGILVRAAMTALFPPAPLEVQPRVKICDVEFDNLSMKQAIRSLEHMLDENKTHQVCFVNPACINIASGVKIYRRILARASMVLPDGIGTKIAADLLGTPLRQNVNGTDLFPRLCDLLNQRSGRLFLLGGQQGVAEKVAKVIEDRWPNVLIVGVRDGFFSTSQEGEVAEQVRVSQADVLLVAQGVPMQDIFIDRYIDFLGVKIAMGVGGLFDFVSGRINRAPDWMREMGLEWVYRFLQEPRRMWSRYLVGNFTFLARVIAQRVGLRRNTKVAPVRVSLPQEPVLINNERSRAIIFATFSSPRGIPVHDDFPAALLPLGSSTIIEQLMTQLSAISIKEIDIVVSLNPEGLREVLGNGERWGVKLNWHLAKDPQRPYEALRGQYTGRDTPVLLGHADCWLSQKAMTELIEGKTMAMQVDAQDRLAWLGWASINPALLKVLSQHGTKSELEALLSSTHPQRTILNAADCALVHGPESLLKAQDLAFGLPCALFAPATWLKFPWGCMSPEAYLSSDAEVLGPAIIGPGCMIMDGAKIGPSAVLTKNVVVSHGTKVSHSIVMPGSFLSHDLDVDGSIVNAEAVLNVRLNVRTVLEASEGVLLGLSGNSPDLKRYIGQVLAIACAAGLQPVVLPYLAMRRILGKPLPWRSQIVVTGRDPHSRKLYTSLMRCSPMGLEHPIPLMAHFGALLDVAQGVRRWFGVRPRHPNEWYSLSHEWQGLLAGAPIGLMHSAAWKDVGEQGSESIGAADVFYVVQHGSAEYLRISVKALKRFVRPK